MRLRKPLARLGLAWDYEVIGEIIRRTDRIRRMSRIYEALKLVGANPRGERRGR